MCGGDEQRGGGKNQVKRWTRLAAIAAELSSPALAQETTAPSGDTPPPAATEIAPTATTAARQIYTPADFARYAPVNAYDMLVQVPGFQIRDSEELRGLGQATGNVLFNGERSEEHTSELQSLMRISYAVFCLTK